MRKWLLMGAQAAIKDVLEQLKQSTLQLTHSLKVCCACQAEHMHTGYLLDKHTHTAELQFCAAHARRAASHAGLMFCEHIVDTTTFVQLVHKEFHCGLLVPVCGPYH